MNRKVMLLILMTLATACRTPELGGLVPALITNPGPEVLEEVEQTLSNSLGGVGVTLAEDVFTSTSILVLERGMQRGVDRTPELGRDLGRPYRFQLVTDGTQCILIEAGSDGRWPLPSVECAPEQGQGTIDGM